MYFCDVLRVICEHLHELYFELLFRLKETEKISLISLLF